MEEIKENIKGNIKEKVKEMLLLYAVTDRAWVGRQSFHEQVTAAIKGGATCIQLREKDLSEEEFLKEAKEIKSLCRSYGIPFIINDNVKIALECGADGIHVGQSDMEAGNVRLLAGDKMIVGVSVQTVEQALAAQEAGADYLGVGAVFSTSTKEDADEVSYDVLKEICNRTDIPVVAIGGINKANMMDLAGTGIDGVALVSAVFASNNIEQECGELKKLSQKMIAFGKTTMNTVLSIAGSDCSGGAGIQADLKTMAMNGVYGMSAVTALTAQNTTGVRDILEVSPEFLKNELDAIFEDIYPDAIKIGMVSSAQLIKVIGERLKYYKAKNIVVDPVMVATSGSSLMRTEALSTLIQELFPIASVVTPNIPEAEVLSGMTIRYKEDMEAAAEKISREFSCVVLLKGGHSLSDADDLLCEKGKLQWIHGKKISNPNTHGTGCTLSSAIASNLAKGFGLLESIQRAKEYITEALAAQLDLGKGSGPMNHSFPLSGYYAEQYRN